MLQFELFAEIEREKEREKERRKENYGPKDKRNSRCQYLRKIVGTSERSPAPKSEKMLQKSGAIFKRYTFIENSEIQEIFSKNL